MSLTVQQAVDQLSAQIKSKGKFSFSNLVDSVTGFVDTNQEELQAMLNKFLKKSGILTEADEKSLAELLERQKQEEKKKKAIRTKNLLIGLVLLGAAGGAIYIAVKKKKN